MIRKYLLDEVLDKDLKEDMFIWSTRDAFLISAIYYIEEKLGYKYVEALRLRFAEKNMTYKKIGARINPKKPLSQSHIRQMILRSIRMIRRAIIEKSLSLKIWSYDLDPQVIEAVKHLTILGNNKCHYSE